MRIVPAFVLATVVAAVAAACTSRQPPVPPSALAAVPVQVNVTCTDQEVTFSLSPWAVVVPRGQTVEWVLNDNALTTEIEVSRKRNDWPFANGGPYRGRKGAPANAGQMKGNVQGGKRYSYSVTMVCQAPNGPPLIVVVDPDIIVN